MMFSILIGWVFFVVGCFLIHPGLGFIVLGLVWMSDIEKATFVFKTTPGPF